MTIDSLASDKIAQDLESHGFSDLQIAGLSCKLKDTVRTLVLVSQKDVYCLGLLSTHYTLQGRTVVYIDKLDTSGYYQKTSCARSLPHCLVQSYLQTLGTCRLHVFARAQPQFLFHESAKNPLKHVLSVRSLRVLIMHRNARS